MIALLLLLLIVGVVLAFVPVDPQIRKFILLGIAILFIIAIFGLIFGWPYADRGWPLRR